MLFEGFWPNADEKGMLWSAIAQFDTILNDNIATCIQYKLEMEHSGHISHRFCFHFRKVNRPNSPNTSLMTLSPRICIQAMYTSDVTIIAHGKVLLEPLRLGPLSLWSVRRTVRRQFLCERNRHFDFIRLEIKRRCSCKNPLSRLLFPSWKHGVVATVNLGDVLELIATELFKGTFLRRIMKN